jgi:hypothetical protein
MDAILCLDGCYIVMLVLDMLLCGLVMCEYVIVWSCSGYGRLGSECWQHSGCSLSHARLSGVTKSRHKLRLHRNPRPIHVRHSGMTRVLVAQDCLVRLSHATNSIYTETPGLFMSGTLARL